MQNIQESLSYKPRASRKRTGIAAWCAYAGLICGCISIFLIPRSRWALPFIIASLILSVIGARSPSHLLLVRVSLLMGVITFGILLPFIASSTQQPGQISHMRAQELTFMNQRMVLQDERDALHKLVPLLAGQLRLHPNLASGPMLASDVLRECNDALHPHDMSIQLTNTFIQSNHYFLQGDAESFPSASWIDSENRQINNNDVIIANNNHEIGRAKLLITDANMMLPQSQ